MQTVVIPILLLFVVSTAFAETTVEQIAAIVNGRALLLSDIKRYHLFFGQKNDAPSEDGSGLAVQLEQIIDHLLLRAEAERFVLHSPSENEIHQHLDLIRRRFKNEEAFKKALRQFGLSIEEFKKEVVDDLWVQKLLRERINAFIVIPHKEVEKYYQERSNLFLGRKKEDAYAAIEKILAKEKETLRRKEYIADLRTNARIEINLKSYPLPGED